MPNTILLSIDVLKRQFVKDKQSTMKKQELANVHRTLHSLMELTVSLVTSQIIGTLILNHVKAVLKVQHSTSTQEPAKLVPHKHHWLLESVVRLVMQPHTMTIPLIHAYPVLKLWFMILSNKLVFVHQINLYWKTLNAYPVPF